MASVAAMMASSVNSTAINCRTNTIATSRIVAKPALASRRPAFIRCNAEPESKFTPTEKSSSVTPITPIVTPTPTPVAPKETSPSFWDVFAFGGLAPERINGRLAMLGFVAALGAELATGETLSAQVGNGGVSAFVFAAILLSTASLIPLFKGVSPQSKSKDFFSSDAETWNGRAAMIGLVALAITEFVRGSPLI